MTNEERRRARRDARLRAIWGLIALAALAIVVRTAAVAAVRSYRLERVTYEHGEIARNLVEGRGFTVRWMGAEGATSQQAPVYPTLVAAFYWLWGVERPVALLLLQLFQAALGGALAVVVTQLSWELLPDRRSVGWLAGVAAAGYPTLVYATTQVQVASLAALLVVVVLWSASRAARTGSASLAACSGLSSGLLVLTDPILVLVVAVALLVLYARNSLRLALVAVGICVAVVAPWIARNYMVHGELVFVKSTFGYAFWQGNHPQSLGTDKIPGAARIARPSPLDRGEGSGAGLVQSEHVAESPRNIAELERALWRDRHGATLYIDDVVLRRDQVSLLGQYTEPERSRRLFAEVKAYLRAHPSHYVRLCVQRLRFFLFFDETNPKSRVLAYRVSHASLLVASIAGLCLLRRQAPRLWPTYLVFGLVTVFHALTIVSARFHIPVESMQIIWAACAADCIGRRVVAISTALGWRAPWRGGIPNACHS